MIFMFASIKYYLSRAQDRDNRRSSFRLDLLDLSRQLLWYAHSCWGEPICYTLGRDGDCVDTERMDIMAVEVHQLVNEEGPHIHAEER